ncbi:glycosyl hydrolase [Roseisolibacter agri]|uniref:Glycosyl hydrolase n=2 Tax=Roseisolibacter agri TaxID=2014610 RepID=A0AA37QA55_9BACT|nr:glycosyl hydrolase [Roseisolibacter agri]
MRRILTHALALTTLATACAGRSSATRADDGWIPLFDGRTLAGWRASENPATFRVEDGMIVVHGPRAHLFYDGPVLGHDFRDFELRAEVMTRPGANSGIYLRTRFQPTDWPSQGYEVQVNNSHTDWRRTGSLYAVQDVRESERDGEWFTVRAIVRGRRVQVMVNDRQTVDYTEPADSATRLTGGTIALQGHDPASEVRYRNIRIRPLGP